MLNLQCFIYSEHLVLVIIAATAAFVEGIYYSIDFAWNCLFSIWKLVCHWLSWQVYEELRIACSLHYRIYQQLFNLHKSFKIKLNRVYRNLWIFIPKVLLLHGSSLLILLHLIWVALLPIFTWRIILQIRDPRILNSLLSLILIYYANLAIPYCFILLILVVALTELLVISLYTVWDLSWLFVFALIFTLT